MNSNPKDAACIRLDDLLAARGLFPSRSRARDAIRRGGVTVEGKLACKPGLKVAHGIAVTVDDPALQYVSRAALKLIAGLDHFRLDPAGRTGLDLGASTGGFTQVLLERGAAKVFAIDVGHGQFDQKLADDTRVTSIERKNARDLAADDLGGAKPGCIVSDLSFISLQLALPPALELAGPGAFGVFLVKPQFEAGREAIGKGGILRDPALGRKIVGDMADWLDNQTGWRTLGFCASPIKGGDGNQEYLLAGIRDRET